MRHLPEQEIAGRSRQGDRSSAQAELVSQHHRGEVSRSPHGRRLPVAGRTAEGSRLVGRGTRPDPPCHCTRRQGTRGFRMPSAAGSRNFSTKQAPDAAALSARAIRWAGVCLSHGCRRARSSPGPAWPATGATSSSPLKNACSRRSAAPITLSVLICRWARAQESVAEGHLGELRAAWTTSRSSSRTGRRAATPGRGSPVGTGVRWLGRPSRPRRAHGRGAGRPSGPGWAPWPARACAVPWQKRPTRARAWAQQHAHSSSLSAK